MRNRLLWTVAVMLLLLSACGSPPPEPTAAPDPVTAQEAAQAVLDSQTDSEDLRQVTDEDLAFCLGEVYGLDPALWAEAALYAAQGMDAREILILRLPPEGEGEALVDALEEHRAARLRDFYGYAPEQADLLERARVVVREGYVAWLCCGDAGRAAEALTACIQGEASPAAVPDPTPVPALDTSGFIPFDPPNEYDMTLYDTSAILAAYASGDERGLSEKDAAILARCRAVLEECVTQDMTGFEKELALHDWLVAWGEYDETVHDPGTPQGRADNTNPYGMLTGGYGICLGYATTFQLLMDLAGVECITVVGASAASTGDHAWNMVRLEGEWYCVDPTWNDPVGDLSGYPAWSLRRLHHRYFNVTSAYLRETNHQWDYESVPEATAVRFRWNGTGWLPA